MLPETKPTCSRVPYKNLVLLLAASWGYTAWVGELAPRERQQASAGLELRPCRPSLHTQQLARAWRSTSCTSTTNSL